MANPQLDDGYIAIAYSLFQAIYQYDFKLLERRVLDVVMDLTYGAGKSKAEMTIADIQALLGDQPPVRPWRIEETVEELLSQGVLFRQQVNERVTLLGVQKDFDEWQKQGGRTSRKRTKIPPKKSISNIYINTTQAEKLSAPQVLQHYVFAKLNLKPSLKASQMELSRARKIYGIALSLTRSPAEALVAVKDFADFLCEEPWFVNTVQFPFAYMLTRFDRWYQATPKKTRSVRENEEMLGKRFRYDHKIKQWVKTNEPLQPNT